MSPTPLSAVPDETLATGIATPEPERYVSRAELATLMGVSIATVDRLVVDGMPSVTWGRRTRRFRPSIALAWARGQRAA